MGFFDDLGKTISSTSQNVKNKSKGFVDITRLKSQISDEEKKINNYYSNLGKLYYDTQKDNPAPELAELVAMLNASFAHIDELREAITNIENTKTCPNCGTPIDDEMVFCIGCGAKIDHSQQQSKSIRFCMNCGAPMDDDAIFCMQCGAKQE